MIACTCRERFACRPRACGDCAHPPLEWSLWWALHLPGHIGKGRFQPPSLAMERAFKRLRCVGTGIVIDIPSPCNDKDDTNAEPAGLRCEGTGPVINILTPCNDNDDANAKPVGLRCEGTSPVINIPTPCSNNNNLANTKSAGIKLVDLGNNDEEDAQRTRELLLERIAGYESIRAEVDFLLGRGPPCNDGKGKGMKAKVTLHECQVISHTELSRICSEAADSDTQAAEQKKAQDDDIDLDADTLPMGA